MANIGNQVTTVPFIADTFSGNGSQQSFNLVRAPAGTASIAVFIGTAYQVPSSYSLVGTLLTFVTAPTAGASNITVLHLGNGSATQVPSTGSVSLTSLSSDTYGYINAAFSTANTGTASGSYANSAFAAANTATASGSYANSAFSTANSAFAAANTATASGSYANSAFTVANNSLGIDTTQNTNISSASSYANSAFATANSAGSYANTAFLKANTPIYTANSAASYANAAFAKANTAGVGTVTSVATGNGLSGGPITGSGTLAIAAPTWNSIGSYALSRASQGVMSNQSNYALTDVVTLYVANESYPFQIVTTNTLSGTWRWLGGGGGNYGDSQVSLAVRVS
jgi:hypothetical protein